MILSTRDLTKVYTSGTARLDVISGVALQVAAGEFVALQGASGAGKSTLLHLLGGLDEPTRGEVLLAGENLYTMKEQRRSAVRNRLIGFVFQFFHLLPDFTAGENVMLPACIGGMQRKAARQRAEELLSQVGLADRLRHHPSQLSGGEQQRVAICRALVNEPALLLCDEPTGNLDSRTGQAIGELLRQLNKERGYTIIMATHSESVAAMAGRRWHIQDGSVREK